MHSIDRKQKLCMAGRVEDQNNTCQTKFDHIFMNTDRWMKVAGLFDKKLGKRQTDRQTDRQTYRWHERMHEKIMNECMRHINCTSAVDSRWHILS